MSGIAKINKPGSRPQTPAGVTKNGVVKKLRRNSQSSQADGQSPNNGVQKPSGKQNSSKSTTSDPIADLVDHILDEPPPSLVDSHRDKESCPCNLSFCTSWKLDCSKCGQFWHADCVGLDGLGKKDFAKITKWTCPLCWVSPIATKRHDDIHVCYICRNTISLQQSNFEYESSIASQKVRDISKCCTTLSRIDFVDFKKRIDKLSEFDVRLQHILLHDVSLKKLEQNLKEVDKSVSDFPKDYLLTVSNNNDTLAKCIRELQQDLKLLQKPPPPPPASDTSDELLKVIAEKLDKLCSEESGISNSLAELKVSLEVAQSTEHQHPARPNTHSSASPGPDPSFPVHPTRLLPSTEHESPPVPHGQVPVINTKEDFLGQTESVELKTFLDSCTFNSENGHSVISFGSPYQYTGSKSSSQVPAFPDSIKPLLERIKKAQSDIYRSLYPNQHHLEVPEINSCLINKYQGPDSYLPKHSDREMTIHPESSIFTISLGQSCDVKFTERKTGTVSIHSCPDRSLYVMSRRSQEVFDHEIEKGSVATGTQYSLTFRCVNWTHKNSTCMIGDSNTRFLRFGSNKRGTFGEQMPGQKFWAPKIRDIDPVSCMGYANVVLLCGINDIKESQIQCENDIANCYAELKQKIKQIKLLSPSTKAVFVCQLLPTKDLTLNRKVNDFNKLLHFDLFPSCKDVEYVEGFQRFACNRVLAAELSMYLDKHGRFDMLHLNRAGARVLAGLIKQSVFLRLNGGIDKRRHTGKVNGRLYNNVVELGTRQHQSGLMDGCQV